jgi:hypothetical protein
LSGGRYLVGASKNLLPPSPAGTLARTFKLIVTWPCLFEDLGALAIDLRLE